MRRFAVAVFAGILSLLWLGFLQPAAAQSQSSTPAASTPAKSAPVKGPTSKKKTATATSAHTTTTKKRRKPASPRVRRVRRAFVASASLRTMAQQLLQDRTPTAYAGVEAYARRHAKEDADAGALAWLVIGYAHTLDHDYGKAIDPFNRAKAGASELGDYVAYYLGDAYLKTAHSAEALSTLADFSKNFPDSLLIRDAHLVYASALLAEGRAQESAALLEKERAPVRSDVELAIGRAYEEAGDKEKASAALRNVYYNLPNSSEADAAPAELRKLGISGSVAERRTRADLLFKAKHYSDAAHDYHDLVGEVSAADRPQVQLALAEALEKSGSSHEARQVLTAMGVQTGDAEAERLYLLSETARSTSDEDAVQRTLNDLRQFGPASPWLEQALLSAGNMYLLKRDYDRAIDYFRELQQRFPNGAHASSAHWKAAWLTFRQGRTDEARQEFEQQIALYPDSAEIPAALYWRARLAEEEGNPAMARAFYLKLSDRFRNYYYAEFGRQRLLGLPSAGEAPQKESSPQESSPPESPATEASLKVDLTHYALLDHIPPLPTTEKITVTDPPDDNLRVERARLLSNGGLADMAVRELQAAASQEGGTWAPPEMAHVYQDIGRYDRGIEIMKHITPNYFAVDIPNLPRPYWEALFPKAYWTDLRKYSVSNGLDPYLVASLIRQESEFNTLALSRASAVGLMQLLPKTGKTVAKQVKLKGYSAPQLFTPAVNLQLGTRYFKDMVDKYGGQFEYALAAYNAGTDRVGEWLGQGHYRDPQEFVESIPFTETREYVQAILRNANVYRKLYGTP
ncbi:MAG TPA: transglycosylase SLT domain-containing protein [Terriglobales bacterium]|nr:transglycosylase SLT domain-containing protein [Terriglobales bacterium]